MRARTVAGRSIRSIPRDSQGTRAARISPGSGLHPARARRASEGCDRCCCAGTLSATDFPRLLTTCGCHPVRMWRPQLRPAGAQRAGRTDCFAVRTA
eukprot:5783025-Prymnesium_polylepis.2